MVQIQKAKNWLSDFRVGVLKNKRVFSSWDPKICCILRKNLRIELIFWMLIVMQNFLVRLISYSLTFKCWESTLVVILVLVAVDRSQKWRAHCYSCNFTRPQYKYSTAFGFPKTQFHTTTRAWDMGSQSQKLLS